jgi:hypothetical protein
LNLRVSLKIARVLTLASARARRSNSGDSKLSNGLTSAVLGGAFFIGSAAIAFYIASLTGIDAVTLRLYLAQFLIVMPSMATFFCLVYGLLFEFNQSVFHTSVDVINWLPISATDYVLGSTLCTLYFCFPILAIVYGATLGVSIISGGFSIWVLAMALSLLGAFIGGFTMELIRVVFNRASSSIGKRSGRTAVVGRLVVSILLIAVFSSIYNFNIIVQITAWFTSVAGAAWFFPLIWPSLSILALLASNILGAATYFALSVVLMVAFFYAGTKAREANWVPEQTTMSFASKPGEKRHSDEKLMGFTLAESAIIRKDLRGLIRRREMAGFLAMPFIMVLVNLINGGFSDAFNTGAPLSTRLIFFALPGFGLLLLGFYVAAVCIGGEGSGFINLLSAPISARQIARAKIATALTPTLPGLAIIVAAVEIVLRPNPTLLVFVTTFGLVTIVESVLVGLIIGARFPDYTEVPRARFVTPTGILIGMVALAVVVGATFAVPFLLGTLGLGGWELIVDTVAVAIIGTSLTTLIYRLTISETLRAYESAPV